VLAQSSTALKGPPQDSGRPLRGVIDACLRLERGQQRLALPATRGHRLAAQRSNDLHGKAADAAGGTVHQHAVAAAHFGEPAHLQCGHPGHRHGTGAFHIVGIDGLHVLGVDRDELLQCPRRTRGRIEIAHHGLADLEPADPAAERLDGAAEFGADASRRLALEEQPELALDKLPVEGVDRRALHAHQHLAARWPRLRHLGHPQDGADRAEGVVT